MSSSDETAEFDVDRNVVNRTLFVRLLGEHPIVIDKSKIPSVVISKKNAWERISKEYSQTVGKPTNAAQLLKMFNNMKTKIKKKTDKKTTGNKPINLTDWEKDFLSLLHHEENPVFTKVPGSVAVYGNENCASSSGKGQVEEDEVQHSVTEMAPNAETSLIKPKPTVKKGCKRLLEYESVGTMEMSTTELQRAVLLQQMQLQQIQIEKEKMLLANLKKQSKDAATSTDDLL